MNVNCIFSPGQAHVVNLPPNFDLIFQFKTAKTIRLATAFARKSGWDLLRKGISESKAKLKLLTGLDFNSTEPDMLRTWYELVLSGQATAKLFNEKGVSFHPKVLIVEGNNLAFGIVGSGNLSAGGLQSNVECSIYIDDPKTLENLIAWFDELFNDISKSIDIAPENIEEYKKFYRRELKHQKRFKATEHHAITQINKTYKSYMELRQRAVEKAKKFITTSKFKELYASHKSKAEKIKEYLGYPRFRFTKNGVDEFFKIQNLGHIIPICKPSMWEHRLKVSKILQLLVDESWSIVDRINMIYGKNANEFYFNGLGMNLLTKILAVHKPQDYPVDNNPVRRALKMYRYHQLKRASIGTKYEQLAIFMRNFNKEAGLPDMLALDAFLYSIGEGT